MAGHTSLDRFFKLSLGLLAWVVLAWIMFKAANFLVGIVVLFGMSLLFTYLLLAPVNVMELLLRKLVHWITSRPKLGFLRQRLPETLPRVFAIVLVYLAFALTTLIISVRFVPVAFEQLHQFSNELPKYVHQGEEWILNQPFAQNYFHQEVTTLKSRGELTKPQEILIESEARQLGTIPLDKLSPAEKQVIREKIFGTSGRLFDFAREHIGGTFQNLLTIVSSTLAGFVYTLTGLVLVFYFLLDGKDLKNGFISMLPRDSQASANYLLSNIHLALFGFVKGQVMLGIVTGIYMVIVYSLFDVPYSFFLGAFFAIAEIIPVVGTWLGFFPGILVLLFINPLKLIFVMGLVYVYQLIKDNLVAPRVLGQAVGLHPVIVIVSLLVCAKISGLVGVLFAIPLASIVNVLIRFAQQKDAKHLSIEPMFKA